MAEFVEVLVDCAGIEEPLTYAVPEGMELQLGDIVIVPLAGRTVGAIVLTKLTETDIVHPKPVLELIGTGWCSSDFWLLLQMTARHYRTPLIQTLRCALPPQMLESSQYRWQVVACPLVKLTPAGERVWQICQEYTDVSQRFLRQKIGKDSRGLTELKKLNCLRSYLAPKPRPQAQYQDMVLLLKDDYSPSLSPRQMEVIHILKQTNGELSKKELLFKAKTTTTTIKKLVEQGLIAIEQREILRLGGKSHLVQRDVPKILTDAQAQALFALQSGLDKYQTFLLEGVTGSGKTEVYLQVIAAVLKLGKSALVLVPEIGLTPQLSDRFRARFGDSQVILYHSQLSDGERFDTWRMVLMDQPLVVIGTRSAVFLPLPNLGIIILDEEHDASFKQDQPQPCYHARTVAQWRCQLAQIPLVLGTATPSSEAIFAQGQGKMIHLPLPHRVGNRSMPTIIPVDMRLELAEGNFSIFSRLLKETIAQTLARGQQTILFIHRRGFHSFVSCRECGFVIKCLHCDVSLTYHLNQSEGSLRCHYCGHHQPQPHRCPACHSTRIKHFGSGTQRVEQELSQLFPSARLLRFDSDTTRNKDQHHHLLSAFRAGEADILIGTQMLTKGLDIPEVTLVGIVSADGLLNFSDYRASERACQTLLQVAGRCGRGETDGRVILQTYTPDHPAIVAVVNYQYRQFLEQEISQRQELSYPPCGKMALIRLSSEKPHLVESAAHELAQFLRDQYGEFMQILGAQAAAISHINDRWRWQIILKSAEENADYLPDLSILKSVIHAPQVRVSLDIDPLQVI
jgi:primosomal protein N' (replication factor Y)